MKVYVETNPETIYLGRVKDEVKTAEVRMWFETDEEIEVLSLSDYTKQVRKEVATKVAGEMLELLNSVCQGDYSSEYKNSYTRCVADMGDCLLELKREK